MILMINGNKQIEKIESNCYNVMKFWVSCESIIRAQLSVIDLYNISITCSHSMTSVSEEKALNFKDDFILIAL